MTLFSLPQWDERITEKPTEHRGINSVTSLTSCPSTPAELIYYHPLTHSHTHPKGTGKRLRMRKNKTLQCEQEIRVWVKAGFCSLRGILYTWMCCLTGCSVLIFLPHVMQCEYSWRLCMHVSSNPSLFPLLFRVPVPESTRADLIDKRMQWSRRAEVVCDAGLMPRCRSETAAWLLAVKHAGAGFIWKVLALIPWFLPH